jgi:enamine deaminase RidA (YjgF/YER057c/UK114 family)
MTEQRAILPEGWARARGYSYAVATQGGTTVRIAGQIAVRDGKGPVDPGLDFGAQFALALANIVTVVRAAGGEPQHVVNLRAYVTDMAAFHASGAAIGEGWRASLGKHFPAMTLVGVTGLVDPNAKVEIEAEAVIP